jgi:hypothetical protein
LRWYFVLRTERLPRQARDQHRVNSHTGCVFLQGVKRKYIRAYQFAYSRIDEVEGDPTSHTARGVIASNLRGEVPENVVVTAHALHARTQPAGWPAGWRELAPPCSAFSPACYTAAVLSSRVLTFLCPMLCLCVRVRACSWGVSMWLCLRITRLWYTTRTTEQAVCDGHSDGG